MTEVLDIDPPVIIGPAGDIGRTVTQQLAEEGVAPAGVVLNEHRLETAEGRTKTAEEIASNFVPGGQKVKLEGVELPNRTTLRIGDFEIPIFTPAGQDEIISEGYPVIDATGKFKTRPKLEGLLELGAPFVLVTCPIHEREDIPAVVYGVNSDDEVFDEALEGGLVSTSSCTTTAVSSFLGPVLKSGFGEPDKPRVLGVSVDVSHARTKSNDPAHIGQNILLSPSGAVAEIPKVLGLDSRNVAFNLECTRADANVGSLAHVTFVLFGETPTINSPNFVRVLRKALAEGSSSYAIDKEMADVKGVIGRRESAVVNLEHLKVHRMPDGGGMANGIFVFYDNVAGYTRSALDSYKGMTKAMARRRESLASEETATA